MPAAIARIAILFLIVLCGCAAAQEGKKPVPTPTIPIQSTNNADQGAQAVGAQARNQEQSASGGACEKRIYKLKMMANGFYRPPGSASKDQGFWGSMVYMSPNGVQVTIYRTDFQSSEAASKAFQAILTGAMRVLERGPVKGHEIPADSDRVLLVDRDQSFAIVWLDGKFLRSTWSSSLQGLKDFEETVEFSCK